MPRWLSRYSARFVIGRSLVQIQPGAFSGTKMEIESYYEFVSKEKQENPLAELTGPIAVNLKEVVDIAMESHSKIEIDTHTHSNRKKIAEIAEGFHKNAGTLTPRVKHSLELLANRDVVLIESAHQPTLFPYSDGIDGHICQI
jgi:hypothetical protein